MSNILVEFEDPINLLISIKPSSPTQDRPQPAALEGMTAYSHPEFPVKASRGVHVAAGNSSLSDLFQSFVCLLLGSEGKLNRDRRECSLIWFE